MTKALKALFWKEWRETRGRWLALLLAFHIPLAVGLLLALTQPANDPSAGVEAVAAHRVVVALFYQTAYSFTVGLFLIAFFAAGSFAGELERRQMYFTLDRPIRRAWLLAVKFGLGAAQSVIAVGASLVSTVTVSYAYAGGDVAGASFSDALAASARGATWLALMALLVFSATFTLTVFFGKWWSGVVAGALALVTLLYFMYFRIYGWILYDLVHPAVHSPPYLGAYAAWQAAPLMVMALLAGLFYAAAWWLFERKELT